MVETPHAETDLANLPARSPAGPFLEPAQRPAIAFLRVDYPKVGRGLDDHREDAGKVQCS